MLQIGQVIRGRRVNYIRPRIAATTLLGLSIAFGLARTGTSTITTGAAANNVGCTCATTVKGGGSHGSGGSGTVHIGNVARAGGGGGGTIRISP